MIAIIIAKTEFSEDGRTPETKLEKNWDQFYAHTQEEAQRWVMRKYFDGVTPVVDEYPASACVVLTSPWKPWTFAGLFEGEYERAKYIRTVVRIEGIRTVYEL